MESFLTVGFSLGAMEARKEYNPETFKELKGQRRMKSAWIFTFTGDSFQIGSQKYRPPVLKEMLKDCLQTEGIHGT